MSTHPPARRRQLAAPERLTVRPSLVQYFATMGERLQANRAVAIGLFAAGSGYLVAMTVMSRFSVPVWLVLPALFVLYVAFAAPYVAYAMFITLIVRDGGTAIERSSVLSRQTISTSTLDFVRYRVRYGSRLAGKKYYLAVTPSGGCQFYLTASVWKEADIARVATEMHGSLRGTWNNVIDVDMVRPTLGGPCLAW